MQLNIKENTGENFKKEENTGENIKKRQKIYVKILLRKETASENFKKERKYW